ncbi:MAG: pilus assembly protein PilM [Planctomycetota bacterium]|nr:pilus assembly protein PilM [Planctomycetota bacterium]
MGTGLGIDVGTEWIKVVQVRTSGNTVTVTGAVKLPRGGGGGPDLPPELQGALVVPETLGQELARAGLKRSGTLGISGREVILKYVSTPPMPPDKLKKIIDMQVADRLVSGRKGAEDEGPAVTYDFRLLNVPTGLKGDLVVMAGVSKNEFLFGNYGALRKAGIGLKRITPAAFGLVQAYLRTQKVPEGETVVLVDVGHENTEVAILQEENLFFARSAPGGGKSFDQALDKLLKLGQAKIHEFKHHRAKLHPDGAKIASQQELQFQTALKEGADNIANAIRGAIMFCRTQAKMPKLDYQRIFLSGGGARLNGLREYLEGKTKRTVQVLDLYTGLDLRKLDAQSAKCFEGDVPDMAVALGLAIVDADPKCFHFQLLPEPVIKKRIFWTKTVWAAAAGVALMLGLFAPYNRSVEAVGKAGEKKADFEKRVDEAKAKKKEFESRKAKVAERTLQIDYYAQQTRLGPVLLNCFAQLRANVPRGMTITYVAPGETTGSTDYFDNPMRTVQIRGVYDTDAIKDFNAVAAELFKKLREVPGVLSPGLDLGELEREKDLAANLKPFRFNLSIASPERPIAVEKAEPAPPAKPPEPGPAAAPPAGKTDAKSEPAPEKKS